jgi:RNA polymerase sigma-70 factor (ECF subfamily)
MTKGLGEHFFRHEFGRLTAALVRHAGMRELEAVEDAAQAALLSALESWPRGGVPDNPSAWLFRVARNHFVNELRRRTRREALAGLHGAAPLATIDEELHARLTGDVRDDLLRVLFVCCDEELPVESQLVLALKTLCGFDVREIAERLFTTEANVYKRLGRARQRLREVDPDPGELSLEQLASRLPAVRSIVYVLFTEGYLSSHAEGAIRHELCDEARRLAELLAEHPLSATPESFALLSLICLHGARTRSRKDASGGLLLLEEQDRSLWNQSEIALGLSWLARSAQGNVFSRYHAEAGIAAEHCLAPSFGETRWERIVESYALLDRLAPSPLHTLNRVVALAEWRGPAEALALLEAIEPPAWLVGSYLWSAVLADLHRRSGHAALAAIHGNAALAAAPSEAVRSLLERRLRLP